MEIKYFQVNKRDREALLSKIRTVLNRRADILFAYLHGSFVAEEQFRDIDLAVFLMPPFSSPLQVELVLEAELAGFVKKYPVEVRVLNRAPLSFQYNVIKHGKPLVVADDDARCDFVEATLRDYFDFAPFRRMYLKEVLGSGI